MKTNTQTNKKRSFFKLWDPEGDKKLLKFVAVFMVITASFIIIKDELAFQLGSTDSKFDSYEEENDNKAENKCNVLGIELYGNLVTYIPSCKSCDDGEFADMSSSDDIVYVIQEADKDKEVKAIMLAVDSYGGLPVAGEEVADALKRAKKPTVALIRGAGVSAAYLAATGADKIFASKNSDIGSIAVTMSYLDYSKKNQKEGLTYISLSSGKFKDAGDPDRPLSPEEKNLFMRDINIMHKNFVELVAENRNLDAKKVEKLADGSSVLGEMALQNGLIDQIGGIFEVKEYLKEKIGEDVVICW